MPVRSILFTFILGGIAVMATEIDAPDRAIKFSLNDSTYSVSLKGRPVIKDGRLGRRSTENR